MKKQTKGKASPYKKQTKVWRTKDGRRLRVCDMEDGHLLNTERFLVRYAKAKHANYVNEVMTIASFFSPSSDTMAAYYLDQDVDRAFTSTWEEFLPDIYLNVVGEMLRRKLKPLK